MSMLVANGADVSAVNPRDGLTPLLLAAQRGLIDVATFLVENGADVGAIDRRTRRTALHAICERFTFEEEDGDDAPIVVLCRQMIDRRPELVHACDGRGCTPIHGSTAHGHLGVTRLLLERGASADVVDHDGKSPLMRATCRFLPHGALTGQLILEASSRRPPSRRPQRARHHRRLPH